MHAVLSLAFGDFPLVFLIAWVGKGAIGGGVGEGE